MVAALAENLGPAASVVLDGRVPAVAAPWALLPVAACALVLARVPAGVARRRLRAALWVALWVALPVVAAGVWGGIAGRDLTWLGLIGGAEVLAATLVYRALRRVEMRRRDPLGTILGRRPGILGDSLRLRGEDRFLHMAVLGPTGSGKTRGVLMPVVVQDLGRAVGVTLVDPKGDLARATVRAAADVHRPCAVLRPGDPASVRVNPLDAPAAEAAETVVYAFDRAFPAEHPFYRPLGQNLLRFATRALVEVRPGSGLADLNRFLVDETFRLEILVRVEDDAVRRYFRDVFATWPARTRAEYTAGVVNTLLSLLGQPDLAAVLSPPATFDLEAHLREGGVLVADLPVGRLGAAASLAGAFLLASLQRLALARPDGARAHFLYIDEFGTFAPGGFGEFLAMARSKSVGAVLAHQHLGQLGRPLREALEANARTRVILGGVSVDDGLAAARMAVAPRVEEAALGRTLRYLPRGEAVVFRVEKGEAKPPVRIVLPRPAADA